jgi:DNA-binding NarL/FixJ family response regulator
MDKQLIGTVAKRTLTPRQFEVARLMAAGFSNKEIGKKLNISEQGAKHHVSAIYRRLGFGDAVGLGRVAFAIWWSKNGDWEKYADYVRAANSESSGPWS